MDLRTLALAASALCLFLANPAWAATCGAHRHAGGEWPVSGHDLHNTRDQAAEHLIGAGNVWQLRQAWHFDTGNKSGLFGIPPREYGEINSTPIVAFGCVYLGTAADAAESFNVFALNADSGELVWKQHVATTAIGNGGAIVGSPVVSGLRLIVLVNQLGNGATADPQSGTVGPYLVAFDRRDGKPLWRSAPIVTGMGYYTNATPTIERGVVVAGFSSVEGDPHGQGGVALLDERTGAILKWVYTVPSEDWAAGYAGGGVWTTPAADDGYVYYGVGNPSSKQIEHAQTNAILKVDVDRRRHATFGRVVASYKGNVEQIYQAFQDAGRPLCSLEALTPSFGDFSTCLQLDLDFGAAPNLFPGTDGTLLVGELQKSGVYHAARAADMRGEWMRLLDVSCLICNGAASAWDAVRRSLYVNLSPTDLLAKVSSAGDLNWYRPDVDGLDFEAVSLANGVVYLVDQLGTLLAWDAQDGALLLVHSTLLDGGHNTLGVNSAGVAIARNTVYVPAGPMLFAYRLP
jgi:hypothetical protein